MTAITEMTKRMGKNKIKKNKEMISKMDALRSKGLDTFKISTKISSFGIKTISNKEVVKILYSGIRLPIFAYLTKQVYSNIPHKGPLIAVIPVYLMGIIWTYKLLTQTY